MQRSEIHFEQTFRWYGPHDLVALADIRQTGATGIVSALHHIPSGDVWPVAGIKLRKAEIEEAGMNWAVVESVNVHEQIKTASAGRDEYIENYIQTLKNLAACGIKTVCYNFMPVLDWTRTDLNYMLPDKASALRYDAVALAAFDLHILQRKEAAEEYDDRMQQLAGNYFRELSEDEKHVLTNTVLAGLPGTGEVLGIADFKQRLAKYAGIGPKELKQNLSYFLNAVVPEAEKAGVKLCIHPDDPPVPILGLPRVVCNQADLDDVLGCIDSQSNGITFCTGSLGANPMNDLPAMAEKFGPKIHFLHLRNVQRQENGSFYEAAHLDGSSDMFAIMQRLINEQRRRQNEGRNDLNIPMRPDHGHKILDDLGKNTIPGYPVIGRMKGLAELRGLELGIRRSME